MKVMIDQKIQTCIYVISSLILTLVCIFHLTKKYKTTYDLSV